MEGRDKNLRENEKGNADAVGVHKASAAKSICARDCVNRDGRCAKGFACLRDFGARVAEKSAAFREEGGRVPAGGEGGGADGGLIDSRRHERKRCGFASPPSACSEVSGRRLHPGARLAKLISQPRR
jgi:hypothetical protein